MLILFIKKTPVVLEWFVVYADPVYQERPCYDKSTTKPQKRDPTEAAIVQMTANTIFCTIISAGGDGVPEVSVRAVMACPRYPCSYLLRTQE